jgi:nucleoid DNA-binding protein
MEKISWAELRKVIAQRINADEKEVGIFMNALAPAITKALQEDRQVRITNFGTFKLQTIAPRKSVNVATGEAFTLPGYDKLTFSPESSIKELLGNLGNKPAPTEDEATPLKKLGEQADEIVGLLNELGQAPDTKTEEPKVEELKPEEPKVEEPKVEAPKVEEPKVEEPKVEEPLYTPFYPDVPEPQKPKCRTWLVVGLTIIILTVLLALSFLFWGNRFVEWIENMNKEQVTEEVIILEEPVDTTTQVIEEEIEPIEPEELEPASTLPYPYEYTEFIAKEYLPRGSRLAWLARKYYGERELWVFIYEANRDVVEHPSQIEVGTLIRIPKLPDELRDFSNPELQELVERLATEYKQL